MNLQLTVAETANSNLILLQSKTDTVSSSILTMSVAISSYVGAQVQAAQAAAAAQVQAAQAAAAAQVQAAQAAAAALIASETARRETAAMNDPNYQGNYDEYVISQAAQLAAEAASAAAISAGKNSSDAQLDAIKATTSVAIESVEKISTAIIETNAAVKAMADAANNKTFAYQENDYQSLVNLENIAVQAGYSGDYTDTYAMQAYLKQNGYAKGGMASGLSLVGEQGAELINFNSPANVTSHSQTTGLFDSIGEAMNDQNIILEDQVKELKALVNLQSNANMVLINEMKGMREELSTISRKAKLEAAA
jgi:hypothetical protein